MTYCKCIVSVCALLMLLVIAAPSAAFAQAAPAAPESKAASPKPASKPTFRFDARIRPRGEFRSGQDFELPETDVRTGTPGVGDLLTLQSRLGISAKKDALTGRFLLQHAAIWGATGGGSLTQPPLNIAHAWATYQASDLVGVTMGRFVLGYGDERVLGAVGWDQNTRAWDGVRLSLTSADGVRADAFAVRSADGLVSGASTQPELVFDGDAVLVGTYVSLGALMGEALNTLDVYLLGDFVLEDLTDDNANPRQLATAGALGKGAWGAVDVTVEGAYQLGSQCRTGADGLACGADSDAISAFFVDGEVGATVVQSSSLRFFVAGSVASGDDPETDSVESYNHLYPTAHKFMGRTDVVGPRSNVTEGRAGASIKLGAFSLRESAHYFQRIQPKSERLGIEFDTTLGYKVDKGFVVGAGHGVFFPGPAVSLSSTTPDKAHNWFYIQTVSTWSD